MANLELRCRAYNELAAEHDFGRERVREMRRKRRLGEAPSAGEPAPGTDPCRVMGVPHVTLTLTWSLTATAT